MEKIKESSSNEQRWVCGCKINEENDGSIIAQPPNFMFVMGEKTKKNIERNTTKLHFSNKERRFVSSFTHMKKRRRSDPNIGLFIPFSEIHNQLKETENYARKAYEKVFTKTKNDTTNFVTADIGFVLKTEIGFDFIKFPVRDKNFRIINILKPSKESIKTCLKSYDSPVFKDEKELEEYIKNDHVKGNMYKYINRFKVNKRKCFSYVSEKEYVDDFGEKKTRSIYSPPYYLFSAEKTMGDVSEPFDKENEKRNKIQNNFKKNIKKIINLSRRTFNEDFHNRLEKFLEKEKLKKKVMKDIFESFNKENELIEEKKRNKIQENLERNTRKMINLSRRTFNEDSHNRLEKFLEKEKLREIDEIKRADMRKLCSKEIEQVDDVNKNTRFKHSERLLFKFLINNADHIAETLKKIINFKTKGKKFDITILYALLFLHSSRYVCSDCENVILSAQSRNSPLQIRLKEELRKVGYRISNKFFGLQTIITADIPFPNKKSSVKKLEDYEYLLKGYLFIINEKDKNNLFCSDTNSKEMHVELPGEIVEDPHKRTIFMSGTLSKKTRTSEWGKLEDIKNIQENIFKGSMERMKKAAITIQRYWRGYVQRKNLNLLLKK